MRKPKLSLTLCLTALFLLLVGALPASAQVGTASINGTVTDAQGAAVKGATVTLKSPGTGVERTATTDDSGSYNFKALPPATYTIEVSATGFKKASVPNVAGAVDNTTTVDVPLEVGDVGVTVVVETTAAEALVNKTDASIGNNFTTQQIVQLPLNARNVGNLLSLQPGVTPDGYVNGGRSDQANLTLDGVDVNEQQTGEAFSPVLRVSPDSVEEFRVTTSNANATQGRSSGAQVSFVTIRGKNDFHGALYEYHRNTATTANNYFNNAAGRFVATDEAVTRGIAKAGDPRLPRPKLLRNVFGGKLGGPIMKDRLFFFYNYEGRRDAREESVVSTVPLANLGIGSVNTIINRPGLGAVPFTLTATQINALTSNGQATGAAVVDVNPAALAIFASAARRYPANDCSSAGDGLNTCGFRFNASVPLRFNTHTARFDFNATEDGRHVLSFRGSYQHDTLNAAPSFPDTRPPRTWSHPLGFVAGYTWSISNSLVNNFNYGLTRQAFSDQGESTENQVYFRDVFARVGSAATGGVSRNFNRVTPVTNITDDLSWTRGQHNFQFGTNIRLIRNRREGFGTVFDSDANQELNCN